MSTAEKCPYCGTDINPGFTVCTSCGAEKKKPASSIGCLLALGLAVFGGFLGAQAAFALNLQGIGLLVVGAGGCIGAFFGLFVGAGMQSANKPVWVRKQQ